jgi:hypothetical protein
MKKLIPILFIGACALSFSGCPPEKTQTNISPDGGSDGTEPPDSGPGGTTGTTGATGHSGIGGGSLIPPAQ